MTDFTPADHGDGFEGLTDDDRVAARDAEGLTRGAAVRQLAEAHAEVERLRAKVDAHARRGRRILELEATMAAREKEMGRIVMEIRDQSEEMRRYIKHLEEQNRSLRNTLAGFGGGA